MEGRAARSCRAGPPPRPPPLRADAAEQTETKRPRRNGRREDAGQFTSVLSATPHACLRSRGARETVCLQTRHVKTARWPRRPRTGAADAAQLCTGRLVEYLVIKPPPTGEFQRQPSVHRNLSHEPRVWTLARRTDDHDHSTAVARH